MTKRFERKTALLAKIEAEYGTDSVPAGGANAMLIQNLQIVPLEAEEKDRQFYQSYLGQQGKLLAGEHVSATFEVELAGSGTAGVAPGFGPLLRACGLAETIVADTSVTYAPVSAGFESVSAYTNLDGVNHKFLGARGNVKLMLSAREIPKLEFSMRGLLVPAVDAALLAQTLTAFQTPLIVNKANTPTFDLHGYSAIAESLELDLGNDVQYRGLIGEESIQIVDRLMTGRAVLEADTLANIDWFALARARTRGELDVVHGTVAGNIATVNCPAVEIGAPAYGATQKIRNVTLPLIPAPTAVGNDELTLAFT